MALNAPSTVNPIYCPPGMVIAILIFSPSPETVHTRCSMFFEVKKIGKVYSLYCSRGLNDSVNATCSSFGFTTVAVAEGVLVGTAVLAVVVVLVLFVTDFVSLPIDLQPIPDIEKAKNTNTISDKTTKFLFKARILSDDKYFKILNSFFVSIDK